MIMKFLNIILEIETEKGGVQRVKESGVENFQ